MQVSGYGYRISSDELRAFMAAQPDAREFFLRYAQTHLIQIAHTALANGRGLLEARLARWLLMAHDRIGRDELPLIHDFLALMLGVHRPGVTVAIRGLQQKGVIDTKRGAIIVTDRRHLEIGRAGPLRHARKGVGEADGSPMIPRADG